MVAMPMPDASEARGLARSARAVSLATLISRILGLAREQTAAALFSRTQTDAFAIAFRIPNLLRDLFAEGAMSAAFVPTFTRELKEKTAREAWAFAATVMTLLAILLSGVAVAGMILSPHLVGLFAEDFQRQGAGGPGKFALTVGLTRWMFPFLPMVALAAAAMGCLNARRRFFLPALAPAMFNVASIGCAWLLTPVLAAHPEWGLDPVFSLAVGTLVGGLGQFLIQVPMLKREGLALMPRFDLLHPGVRKVAALMAPGTLGLAAVQLNIFISSVFATQEGEGPVSWLGFSFRFMYLPIGLFGVAMASASLPQMASHHARGDLEAMKGTLARGLRLLMMVTVPATAGLLALSTPIIAAVYQHGRFTAYDTRMTALALQWYASGLVFYASAKILVPAFYTLGKTAIPVAASVASVLANILLSWIMTGARLPILGWRPPAALSFHLGFQGLALATAITAFLNAFLLYVLLARQMGSLETGTMCKGFARIGLASAGMAVVCLWTDRGMVAWLPVGGDHPKLWVQIARLGADMAAGLAFLALACRGLKLEEFWIAVGMGRRTS